MKKTLYQDENFVLEAEKDEYNNLTIKQVFIQDEHKAIDTLILTQDQQVALMNYLNDLIK